MNRYAESTVNKAALTSEIERMRLVVERLERLANGDESAKRDLLVLTSIETYDGPVIKLRLDNLFNCE